METLLPYYTLQEVADKANCTVEQLIRIAVSGRLFLSVIADGWRIEGGIYCDDGETEIIQSDEVVSGLVLAPILAKDILRISRGESVQIEYLEKSENSYARIIKAENQDFPIIGLKELVVGCADANAFLRKLHAQKQHDVKAPPSSQAEPQDTATLPKTEVIKGISKQKVIKDFEGLHFGARQGSCRLGHAANG